MSKDRVIYEKVSSGLRGSRAINIGGRTFGKLTVLSRQEQYDGSGNALWLCRCECGTECVKSSYRLRNCRDDYSCGCSRRRGFLDQAFGLYVAQIRTGAKDRGYVFDLDESDIHEVSQRNCFYCGDVPRNVKKSKGSSYTYNGLDRVDNSKGYILSNIVPCCRRCNRAKCVQSKDEFIERSIRIANLHPNMEYLLKP